MNDTLKQIEEAWETVLLEMDSKLESFASKLPDDGMAADFLELLLFGVSSPELESFLQVCRKQGDQMSL
jgi:anaphase-promoting complex subunit 4